MLDGKHIAFAGKLGGATRRRARQMVREQGGSVVMLDDPHLDVLVVGEAELPLGEAEEQLDEHFHRAAAAGRLSIVSETQFWQQLGLVEPDENRKLYTAAMLAHLLGVPIQVVRRWHRRGLIVPVHEVHRLPYFDFQQVTQARQLAKLVAAGIRPAALETKLAKLARFTPQAQRSLAQLSVIVEGKELLLRQGEGLIEPGGQRRIDFEALEGQEASESGEMAEPVVSLATAVAGLGNSETEGPSAAAMLDLAAKYEEQGKLAAASEMYRAAMAAEGPTAESCFQLAELLYRIGEVRAVRERYFMAVEINADYVEARANLGCVLAETGERDLAVAAFEGALLYHPDYADVHYHLARTLDELGDVGRAADHWHRFLELAPDSPWSDEARERLEQ